MSKEKVLESIKTAILILRDRGEEFENNEVYRNKCIAFFNDLEEEALKLNIEDRNWIDENLKEFHNKEVIPHIDQRIKNGML